MKSRKSRNIAIEEVVEKLFFLEGLDAFTALWTNGQLVEYKLTSKITKDAWEVGHLQDALRMKPIRMYSRS